MTQTAHTPGEWRIGYTDFSGPEYITNGDKAIAALRWGCSCCKSSPETFLDMTKEERANAYIFAAGKDMLEALKQAELTIGRLGPIDGAEALALDDIRAAIAKATGAA